MRHIFHKFPFDKFEETCLEKVKSFISKKGLPVPTNWRDPELLRVLYSSHFDIPGAARLIHNHVIWLNNRKLHQMTKSKTVLIVTLKFQTNSEVIRISGAEQKVFLLFGQRQPISADHPRGFGEMGLHFQSKLLSNASECLKGLDAGSECRKSATMTPIRLASVF